MVMAGQVGTDVRLFIDGGEVRFESLEVDGGKHIERYGGTVVYVQKMAVVKAVNCSFESDYETEHGTIASVEVVKGDTYWQFPDDKFVTYEPSDEEWCRPLGIGREVRAEKLLSIPVALCAVTHQYGNSLAGLICELSGYPESEPF